MSCNHSTAYPQFMSKALRASPQVQWTLGERENGHPMWCVYCGRNSIADNVPIYVLREGGKLPRFSCVCCYESSCKDIEPVVVTCDRCHRPVMRFGFGGGGLGILGSVTPEGDTRTRCRTESVQNGKHVSDKSPLWSARVWDVSANGTPWDEHEGPGGDRYKIVCLGRRHRQEWIIKKEDLVRAFIRVRQLGMTQLRAGDIRDSRS